MGLHYTRCRLLRGILGVFCVASGWAQDSQEVLQPLLKTSQATRQSIPLIIYFDGQNTATPSSIRVRWDLSPATSTLGDDVLAFRFESEEGKPAPQSLSLLKSQFWISALSSAMVWQEPWRAARWTISEIPEIDGPGIGASLSVGMIATASGTTYPKDTAIIGSLNPDTSFGAVTAIGKRLEAAAKSGKKRVILPNVQRFERTGANLQPVEDIAKKNGLEAIFVPDLATATEKVLKKSLPPPPTVNEQPSYKGELFNYLNNLAQKEQRPLLESQGSWPRDAQAFNALSPTDRVLWQAVFANYEEGMDAYAGGLLYVSWLKFKLSNAKLAAVAAWNKKPSLDITSPKDFNALNDKANDLRNKMVASMNQPAVDRNELQSALVLSEKADHIYKINADLEGAQIFARQAFGPRTTAKPEEKELALTRLFTAVQETEYLVNDLTTYDGMASAIKAEEKPVFNRATVWLQQLVPTQLGAGEMFVQGLKQNANKLSRIVILDPHLATYARVLRDAKAQWEMQQRENPLLRSDEKKEAPIKQVGFVPGDAYRPPSPPVPPPPPSSLSDVARALIWVNDYCELEVLSLKYLELDGVFNKNTQAWDIPSRATLNNMIQYADTSARRGIAFAHEIGVDPALLTLVYEHASYLRNSRDLNNNLESLRQLWRCTLLGNMCWQLGYVPRARAMAVNADENQDQPSADLVVQDQKPPAVPPQPEKHTSTNVVTKAPPAPPPSPTEQPSGPDTRADAARDMDTGEMVPATPDLPPSTSPGVDESGEEIPIAPRAVPVTGDEAAP